MDAEVPGELAQERLEELQQLQREMTLAYHRSRVGGQAEILVDGPSRHGGGQICGRDAHHRVVNVATSEGGADRIPEPGDLLRVDIVEATPHSLIGVMASPAKDQPADCAGTAAAAGLIAQAKNRNDGPWNWLTLSGSASRLTAHFRNTGTRFMDESRIREGLTFDDVLLVPGASEVPPDRGGSCAPS